MRLDEIIHANSLESILAHMCIYIHALSLLIFTSIAITVLDRLPLFPVSCYEERYSADFVCELPMEYFSGMLAEESRVAGERVGNFSPSSAPCPWHLISLRPQLPQGSPSACSTSCGT